MQQVPFKPFYKIRMQQNKMQFCQQTGIDDIFKIYSLKWNSQLINPSNLQEFSLLMGAFLCTIIKLSQNQEIQFSYNHIFNQTIQQLDQNSENLNSLVQSIFDLSGPLQGIPATPDFGKIGMKLRQNFEFYKKQPFKLSTCYVWNGQVVDQANDDTNFRIIISQLQNGNSTFLFSTNLDTSHLYPTFQPIQPNPTFPNQQGIATTQQFVPWTGFPAQQPQQQQWNQQPNGAQNNPQFFKQSSNQGILNQPFIKPMNQNFPNSQSPQINNFPQTNSNFPPFKPQQDQSTWIKNMPVNQQPSQQNPQFFKPVNNCNPNLSSPIKQTQEITNEFAALDLQSWNEMDVMQTHVANSQIKIDPLGDSIRLQTNFKMKQNNTLQCQICDKIYGEDNAILSKCCNNKFHYDCYKQDLECKAKNLQDIEKITCFGCEKTLKPFYQFLIAHLEAETWLRLMTIEVIKKIPNNCFNCKQHIAINFQANQSQLIQCASCNAQNCRLCKQKYHGENSKNTQCPSVHKEIIQSMKGMVITICPFCSLIQTKDEKCNHVTCSQCRMDLCAICSVDRRPILAHGNHYHREGCTDYAAWKDKKGTKLIDKYNSECQLCLQNKVKKVCPYPKSLDEYKREKQY